MENAKWMNYTEGDEVRYSLTGQFGIVKDVNEVDGVYTIEIDGIEYSVTEDELSQIKKGNDIGISRGKWRNDNGNEFDWNRGKNKPIFFIRRF